MSKDIYCEECNEDYCKHIVQDRDRAIAKLRARVKTLEKALRLVRLITAEGTGLATDSEEFEHGAPLTKAQIREMQHALIPTEEYGRMFNATKGDS